jgi:hypothetical protein
VEYQSLGEGYHIKAEIDDKRFDIIAFPLPTNRKVETQVKAKASIEGVEGMAGQEKDIKGYTWESLVYTAEYGYLPLDTWKKIRETVAGTLCTVTGSPVNPSSVQMYESIPVSEGVQIRICPKCFTPLYSNSIYCHKCGTQLST